jgi:SpoVK/Ycf46/Vps4 family AAA+-type ATPase
MITCQLFDACESLGGVIIFIDEIDAMVGSRDLESNGVGSAGSGGGVGMHEATRRILSVILQRLEGFAGKSKSIMICATNRKQDLDKALLSRFDITVKYPLPDMNTRIAIFGRYAKQLDNKSLTELGVVTEGMSSRDIKEACQHAERKWTARVIEQGQKISTSNLPTIKDYMSSISIRRSQQQEIC